MRFRPLLSPFGIAALCALALAYAVHTPDVRPATAPPTEFSAERAMAHVRQLARAPRVTGTDAHQDALIYIMSRIAALGVEPRIQATTGIGTRYPVAGRVRNIVARIPGMRPALRNGAVLLMAHYDGVAAGPAAGDDASGVAVLLETLRAIRQGPLLANDVIALFTDSEEAGLLGAAAFAREHAWTNDVGVVLNFEARGTHGPSLMFETGPANLDVIRFLRSVPGTRATSLSTAVYRQLPNDTDLSELAVLGRPALNFGFIGGVERYHTAEDDVAHLSAESVQHHGDQALALTRAFGGARLPRPSGAEDAVFFDLPIVGLVLYPESWALPLALTTLVIALVGLALVARRERTAWLAAGVGVVTLVLSVVAAAFVAAGAAAFFVRLHASLPWGGTPQWRGVYALAIALLTVAVVTAAITMARGAARDRARAIEHGALVGGAMASVAVTVVMPGVSFLFTWPVLAAGLAALVASLAPRVAAPVARWIATAVIIVILAPTVYLMVCVALGLDVAGAAVLAAMTTLGVWLLSSHMETGAAPAHRWRVPSAAALLALACVIAGIFTVRTSAARPAGSAFAYALDSAANGAWLTSAATNAWARARLGQELQVRAESARGPVPPWLLRTLGSRRIVPAPFVRMPAPDVRIVSDSAAGGDRIVTARIFAPGARSVHVSAEPGVVAGARVDGREVRSDRYRARSQRWTLEYVAPADSGFTLTLTLSPGAEHAISVVARHSGIPVPIPARPAGIIPIGSGDVTHVHRFVRLPRQAAGRRS